MDVAEIVGVLRKLIGHSHTAESGIYEYCGEYHDGMCDCNADEVIADRAEAVALLAHLEKERPDAG
jgi:hypothetical protein